MKNSRKTLPFIGVIFFAFIVLLLSIWDIIYNEQWFEYVIILYGILIIITMLFLVPKEIQKLVIIKNIDEFEKSLKGNPRHFKCPSCGSTIAIKISKQNTTQPVGLTCPDCGTTATISLTPSKINEKISSENK
jgi:predicted RNA-binding Zn-ribbon protein involved in translation (DUF1610 family)